MVKVTGARVVVAVTVLVVLYFGSTAFGNALDNRELDREAQALQREIAVYEQQQQQLMGVRAYLMSDEYVQLAARRELGLVMPGETAVVVISPDGGPSDVSGDRWWQRLLQP